MKAALCSLFLLPILILFAGCAGTPSNGPYTQELGPGMSPAGGIDPQYQGGMAPAGGF